MEKMTILYFYSSDRDRDEFNGMDNREVLKRALNDELGSIYSTSDKFMSSMDEFAEDFNDNYNLFISTWCHKFEMTEDEVSEVFDEVYGKHTR